MYTSEAEKEQFKKELRDDVAKTVQVTVKETMSHCMAHPEKILGMDPVKHTEHHHFVQSWSDWWDSCKRNRNRVIVTVASGILIAFIVGFAAWALDAFRAGLIVGGGP